ncbi:hypothetical protein C2857_007363 [Epichloe festucae Fl1]|uniref:Uncharacterized protein n=1 Tax=Epichloe festucae (strain Fl1) TaxID=877507 RepID=A0A7S9KQR4_EPIFF|nr:hypothetical protein C2857_007363 [Epichloe festucae Fl1]
MSPTSASSAAVLSTKRRALLDISTKDDNSVWNRRHPHRPDPDRPLVLGRDPIRVQMRKANNGKYRVYLDLDLLDAILIQCIGQFISINIKTALDSAWSSSTLQVCWAHKPDEARDAMLRGQIDDFANRDQFRSVQKLHQTMHVHEHGGGGILSLGLYRTLAEERRDTNPARQWHAAQATLEQIGGTHRENALVPEITPHRDPMESLTLDATT